MQMRLWFGKILNHILYGIRHPGAGPSRGNYKSPKSSPSYIHILFLPKYSLHVGKVSGAVVHASD